MRTQDQSPSGARAAEDLLDSWKQIASFLRTSVRSVQRWEKTEGLPVYRHQHAKLGSVFAYKGELESWRAGRGLGEMGTAATPNAGTRIEDWKDDVQRAVVQVSDQPELALGAAARESATHFVGRKSQLEELNKYFDGAAKGSTSFICLGGDAGLGKTTLLDTFVCGLREQARPFAVARGRSSERLAGSEAYLPLLEALESLVEGSGGEAVAALMRLVAPTWYVQVAPLWATAEGSFQSVLEEARTASPERLKRELALFLREISAARPLVMVLDDVHWADPSTVEILAYLARKLDGSNLLVLLAYRATELVLHDHPFRSVKNELQERGLVQDLAMEFLTRENVGVYLDEMFGDHDLPATLTEFLFARTSGNPLFLADVVRHLVDRGFLVEQDGRQQLNAPLENLDRELPQSVRSMVERKLERLDAKDRELLGVASIQGQEFETAVVASVLEADPASVEASLERLGRLHRLVGSSGARKLPGGVLSVRYRFIHVLYQNALHDALAPSRRVELSRLVADALLTCHGDRWSTIAAQVALLLEAGHDTSGAADAFMVAARSAALIHANDEAMSLARRSITNAEELPAEDRHPRVLAAAAHLAALCQLSGRYDDAIVASEVAIAAARELGDVEAEVDAICGIATAHFFVKRLDQSYKYAKQALEVARAAGSEFGIATAEAILAREKMAIGEIDAADAHFARATPVLSHHRSQTAHSVDALGFLLLLHAWRLDYVAVDEATAWWTKQVAALDVHFITPHFYLGMALGNRGRLGEAIETVTKGFRLADMNNDSWHVCRLPNTLGWLSREVEDCEDALRLDEQSAMIARQLGYQEAEANAHVNMARGLTDFGEHERALAELRQAERLFKEDIWFRWRYNIRLQSELARHWMAVEDLGQAAKHAEATLELAERYRAPKYIADAYATLGDIAALEDRPDDVHQHFGAATQALARNPCPTLLWRVLSRYRQFALRSRDHERADMLRQRCGTIIDGLADSLKEDETRKRFLKSKAVKTATG